MFLIGRAFPCERGCPFFLHDDGFHGSCRGRGWAGLKDSGNLPITLSCRQEPLFGLGQAEDRTLDILLVDDSKTMRMLVQRALRQAGYRDLTIGEAESGKDALDKLGQSIPKLILSDWNMPTMSGIDFLKVLRAQANSTPFGFITSEASQAIKDLALDCGAQFLITKPFTSEVVQGALTPFLGAR